MRYCTLEALKSRFSTTCFDRASSLIDIPLPSYSSDQILLFIEFCFLAPSYMWHVVIVTVLVCFALLHISLFLSPLCIQTFQTGVFISEHTVSPTPYDTSWRGRVGVTDLNIWPMTYACCKSPASRQTLG